jgi:hypothetical protein
VENLLKTLCLSVSVVQNRLNGLLGLFVHLQETSDSAQFYGPQRGW